MRDAGTDEGTCGVQVVQAGWDGQPVDVTDTTGQSVASVFDLSQNRPNPFNGGTVIEFTIPRSGHTEVRVYNLLGEHVATIVDDNLSAGPHQVRWTGLDKNGYPTATGVYFYTVRCDGYSEAKKMILLR